METTLEKMGFQDVNVCKNILNNLEDTKIASGSISRICNIKDISMFFNDIIDVKGEVTASKIMINIIVLAEKQYDSMEDNEVYNRVSHCLLETSQLWRRFGTKDKALLKGSLKEIHDRLSLMQKKIDNPCVCIDYPKQVLSLEETIQGYHVVLAHDTHELLECGHFLRNCVGEYLERCVNNQCYVLFVKQDSRYKAAIEISTDMRLVQVKKFANKPLDGELAVVVFEWLNKHKAINTSKCIDYYALWKYVCLCQQ